MSDSHKKMILIDGDVHPTALSVLEARDDVELAKVPLEDAAALAGRDRRQRDSRAVSTYYA